MIRTGPTDAQIAHVENCRQRILALAGRVCGASTEDICLDLGLSLSSVRDHMRRAIDSGDVVRRTRSHAVGRGKAVRVFAHESDADAWADAVLVAPLLPALPLPPIPEPVRDAPGEAVRSGYRLELEPDPRYPPFSSTRPGINPDTGRAW